MNNQTSGILQISLLNPLSYFTVGRVEILATWSITLNL